MSAFLRKKPCIDSINVIYCEGPPQPKQHKVNVTTPSYTVLVQWEGDLNKP